MYITPSRYRYKRINLRTNTKPSTYQTLQPTANAQALQQLSTLNRANHTQTTLKR
jgi:hypothetical protein